MAKLYQHQMDETYYTRTFEGGIVTRQIHPDGVAYLKYCGVRPGHEIPPECMSELRTYGWMFTKDEVPFWGEVDWSPRWVMIRPRALEDLTPFRGGRTVDDWLGDGLSGAPRSVSDSLEAQIEAVRERKAREREQHIAELRAETEARLQRIRAEGQAKVEAARRTREREEAAKRERERQMQEERARTRRAAALKGAETRRRNAERRMAEEAEQLEQERRLADKRREAARKAAEPRRRNSTPKPTASVSTKSGTLTQGQIPEQGEPPAILRGMVEVANRIKDFGTDSQPAIMTISKVATEWDDIPEPNQTSVMPQEADDTSPADAEALASAPAPMVPVFAEPLTGQTAMKVAASSSAALPGWMDERRHDSIRAADIVTEDTISSQTTGAQRRWQSLLIWLVILVVLIAGWLREPALIGVLVAMLGLVFVVRNVRLAPLRAN